MLPMKHWLFICLCLYFVGHANSIVHVSNDSLMNSSWSKIKLFDPRADKQMCNEVVYLIPPPHSFSSDNDDPPPPTLNDEFQIPRLKFDIPKICSTYNFQAATIYDFLCRGFNFDFQNKSKLYFHLPQNIDWNPQPRNGVNMTYNQDVFEVYYANGTNGESIICHPGNNQENMMKICNCLKDELNCSREFCCAEDVDRNLWVACSGEDSTWYSDSNCSPLYSGDRNRTLPAYKWHCNENGIFETLEPMVVNRNCCTSVCEEEIHSEKYIACPNNSIWIPCNSSNSNGTAKLSCNQDGNFGIPDESYCCSGPSCMAKDVFGNTWIGCSGNEILRNVSCPSNAPFSSFLAHWQCDENGNFNKSGLDTVECYCQEGYCITEWHGEELLACSLHNATARCKYCKEGCISWLCSDNYSFVERPDVSDCCWLGQADVMISLNESAFRIIEFIRVKTNPLDDPLPDVIDILNRTVTLFIEQQKGGQGTEPMFHNFTNTYSKVLASIAGSTESWNKINDSSDKIITITENLLFSLPSVATDFDYAVPHEVFCDPSSQDLGLWVVFQPKIANNTEFPNKNYTKYVLIKILESFEHNDQFYGVAGITFKQENGQAIFSTRESEIKLNSVVLSFSIAEYMKNDSSIPPTLVKITKLQVNFTLAKKPRGPPNPIIRRSLFTGEEKTFIENTAKCTTFINNEWLNESGKVILENDFFVVCIYEHLSILSILMDMHDYKPDYVLQFLSISLSSTSIFALFATLIIFFWFKSLKSERTTIGKHMCFCLMAGHILVLFALDKTIIDKSDDVCSVFAAILHFTFLAAFAWMALEGYLVYEKVNKVFNIGDEAKRLKMALVIGYGGPTLVVAVTVGVAASLDDKAYGRDELCWLTTPVYIWTFIGPVLVITTGNLIALLTALRVTLTLRRVGPNDNNLSWIKGSLSLCATLGVTWIIGIVYLNETVNELVSYLFTIFNGLQGVFIFFFRCVMTNQDIIKKGFLNGAIHKGGKRKKKTSPTKQEKIDYEPDINSVIIFNKHFLQRIDSRNGTRRFNMKPLDTK